MSRKIITPRFLDWKLSQDILEKLGYYKQRVIIDSRCYNCDRPTEQRPLPEITLEDHIKMLGQYRKGEDYKQQEIDRLESTLKDKELIIKFLTEQLRGDRR